MIAGSSAPLVGLVDTWAVGHLDGAVHLAAIGVSATIFSFVYWAFGFLRMGTTGMVAQRAGAAHADGQSNNSANSIAPLMVRSLTIAAIIGLLLFSFAPLYMPFALNILAPPSEVIPIAENYIGIRIWSAPATMFVYGLTGYLIGTAQAKASLVLQLTLNISNGVLNVIFVIGLGLGVAGVAYGTLIAEWLAAFIGLAFLIRGLGLKTLLLSFKARKTWMLHKFKRILSVNGFIFIRTLFLMLAFALLTRTAGSLGSDALAASHVLTTFLLLISVGLDGFAFATEALAGAAYGAKNKADFQFWNKRASLWAIGTACLYCAAFALFGQGITAMLTDIESVRMAVDVGMPVLVLIPLIAVASYQYDGIMIGATASFEMMISMVGALLSYVMLIMPLTNAYGLLGLWSALAIFLAVRGLIQALLYPRLLKALEA